MTNYAYTLCFIKRDDNILMINRVFAPLMGKWNGVGGRIEEGESPMACILREAYEETGINLDSVTDCGVVTWSQDGASFGGMHIFLAEVENDFSFTTPRKTEEGILDWKKISWILHPQNIGVVSNIQSFLPMMLKGDLRYKHTCLYKGQELFAFSSEEILNK